MNKNFIQLENLSFSHSHKPLFKNINLTLQENGFYLFLGPNGGGKTTLMKLLMGLHKPAQGSIKVNNALPRTNPLLFGYLPQSLHFDKQFPISVFDFVIQGLLLELPWYGRWRKETKEKTTKILEKFSLIDLQHQSIGMLSGGQLQRAMIARSLISDPKILILDEPLSGLDAKSSKNILSLIDTMKGKKTIILITHVMTTFLQKADGVYLVERKVERLQGDALCKHLSLGLFHTEDEGCSHE